MNGFKSQQHRWTKGSIQTCKKLLPDDLAQRPADADQARGDRALDLELRISLACLSVRAAPSLDRRAASRLGPDVSYRCPDFPDRFRLGRGLLHLRAARTASAHLDEGNPASCPACSRSASAFRSIMPALFSKRCSIIKSDFARTPKYGIERKAQPWRNCKYMPLKSIPADRRDGFRRLLHLLRLVCDSSTGNSFRVPFLLCFNSGFFTFRSPRSYNGCRNFTSAPHARRDNSCVTIGKF